MADRAAILDAFGRARNTEDNPLETRAPGIIHNPAEDVIDPGVQDDLMADQSYAAFLRQMQFDESQIQSSLQAAQEAAARRIKGQAGIYDYQRDQSEQNTNQAFESRGMYRSGGRLGAVSDGRQNIDLQQTQFETGIGESTAAMETDAAASIASLRRQRAEEELAARDRLTQRSAEV